MNLTDLVHPGRFDECLDRAELAAAYLACCGGTTGRNHQSDLLQWFRWCAEHDLGVLEVHRVTSGHRGGVLPVRPDCRRSSNPSRDGRCVQVIHRRAFM